MGGDVFQIIPLLDGGLVAATGDVSGKGMPVALTVSLLMGTLHTLAHYKHSPHEILAAMNQRMLARSSGSFTTCLVLRADATVNRSSVDFALELQTGHHIPMDTSSALVPVPNPRPASPLAGLSVFGPRVG